MYNSVQTTVTESQCIFLAIAQLRPSRLVLTRSVNSSNRPENSNVYVQAVRHLSVQGNAERMLVCRKMPVV